MIRTLILIFILSFCRSQELLSQGWPLGHRYPLELPGQVRYAQFPDSLLSFLKAEETAPLEQIRNQPESFQPIPETIQLEQGDVYWLKGAFIHNDTCGRPFLVEADGFREMKRIDEVMEKLWSAVDVYLFTGDSLLQHIATGGDVPPADRLIRDARNLFWITPDYQGTIRFFIRLESKVKIRRPGFGMRLYDQNSLYDFTGFTFKGFDDKPDTYPWIWPLKRVLSVWNSLEYVIDTLETHTFADLQESWDQRARYFQWKQSNLAANHPLWCRLRVVNLRDAVQLFWFDSASDAPKSEAFIPDRQGNYRKVLSGKEVLMENKQIPHNLSLFGFELAARDSAYIYLKYYPLSKVKKHRANAFLLPLFFLDRNEVLTVSRKLSLWKGFILGIFLFQIVYFALRAALERDRLGAYYLLAIIGFLLFFIAIENRANTFLAWQILFEFNILLFAFGYAFIAVGMFLFSNQYLHLKEHFPFLLKVQKVNLILVFSSLVPFTVQESTGDYIDPSLFYQLPFIGLVLFLLGVLLVLYVIIAILGLSKGHAHALSYLIAFFPVCVVGLMNTILYYILQGDPPPWRMNLFYLSIITTTILFAIVVAKRNNTAKLKEVQVDSLIKLNEAKSHFYDNITHEFRTPLTVIRGLTNMISGHEEEKALIQKNSQEVLNLVDRLIGFSKSQAGSGQAILVTDNIIPYLEYLTEALQPLAHEKGIDLELQYAPEEIVFSFDREKIKLIVNNLLSNAIKFTLPGGSIQMTAGIRDEQFFLSVKDSGLGLPADEIPKIFDRYYQVEDAVPGDSQRGGIGLAVTKEQVERLGGSIQVDSVEGLGSTFVISFPLHPFPPGSEHSEPFSSGSFTEHTDQQHIVLLVEDHADVLYYLERLLSPDFKILTASNGEEGFERATAAIPDLVISDVVMPKMDGYRLTAKLKEDIRTSHIPVILLTAKGKHEEKLQGLEGGADAYLTKPFEEDELKIRIKKLIESREQLRQAYSKDKIFYTNADQKDPFLEKAVGILEEHYDDEVFGINQLAEALHLSRMQVHRKLKALTNFSASQFINHFRLEKSKGLLTKKEFNVSEVAYSCGFSDPGYFSRLFSREYGVSPQQYQKSVSV